MDEIDGIGGGALAYLGDTVIEITVREKLGLERRSDGGYHHYKNAKCTEYDSLPVRNRPVDKSCISC